MRYISYFLEASQRADTDTALLKYSLVQREKITQRALSKEQTTTLCYHKLKLVFGLARKQVVCFMTNVEVSKFVSNLHGKQTNTICIFNEKM